MSAWLREVEILSSITITYALRILWFFSCEANDEAWAAISGVFGELLDGEAVKGHGVYCKSWNPPTSLSLVTATLSNAVDVKDINVDAIKLRRKYATAEGSQQKGASI